MVLNFFDLLIVLTFFCCLLQLIQLSTRRCLRPSVTVIPCLRHQRRRVLGKRSKLKVSSSYCTCCCLITALVVIVHVTA